MPKSEPRKILYVSGTRADYGLMRKTLFRLENEPGIELAMIVTGMHLMPEFGLTIREIENDGFDFKKVEAVYEKDTKESMVEFLGDFIKSALLKIKEIDPDIILLLGDRVEMLGGALIGTYLSIPVAHIHGGELSSTVDGTVRHAITKLSHIHLPATEKSAERIKKMGEEEWRIFKVGAPSLDEILSHKLSSSNKLISKYNLDLSEPVIILIQHPVTEEIEKVEDHMRETMKAIKELGLQTIVTYPNADAGGRKIIKVIESYRNEPFIKIYKSLPREEFLDLMKISSAIVGNSSGGIIEAASFNLPFVNIGTRQEERERS